MVNPKLEPLYRLTPLERVIMIFTHVIKAGHGLSSDDESHLLGLYLQESRLVLPAQVKFLECFEDPVFRGFAARVFGMLF